MINSSESPNPEDELKEHIDGFPEECNKMLNEGGQLLPLTEQIFSPVLGPILTGTGDINISHLFSLRGLKSGLDSLVGWSEADEYARSSGAG